MEDPVEDLDAYEIGSVVLSELGTDGTLYGYVDYPRPLKEKIERKFSELCEGEQFEAVDRYFLEQGWKLELWKEENDFGYQVFFGEGVQVDNYYEYGFPYLFAKEEVIGFAEEFYKTHVKERDVKKELDGLIEDAKESVRKKKTEDLDDSLQSYVSKKIMARENIHQFSTGNKVKTRERYIGTVEKVDEKGVHVFNEKNPKNHQHYTMKLEDFKKWVDEGLYRMVAPKNIER